MCCESFIEKLGTDDLKKCFSNLKIAEENKKRFEIKSNSEVCRVKIDDCLVKDKINQRCDYYFRVCESGKNYLVELKGIDVVKGINQIISTYNLIKDRISDDPVNYVGIIVSSSIPKEGEIRFRREREKARKYYKFDILKSHHKHIETI